MFELQQRLSNKDPMPIRCNLYDFNQNLFETAQILLSSARQVHLWLLIPE